MTDSRNVILVERLHEKTLSNKLIWEKTVDEGVYQVTFGAYSIQASKREAGSGYIFQFFSLGIYNEEGTLIEEICESDLEGPALEKLKELHELARRQALGVDKILDSLISELEG